MRRRKVFFDRLRVECNFGSKYFDDAKEALAYFKSKAEQGKEVELWLKRYLYSPKGGIEVVQKMLDCATSFQPIFFD